MGSLLCMIIPTFNRAEFALEAVASCLEQTLPTDWQLHVVVVDDGSTDDTLHRFVSRYAMTLGRDGFYESPRISYQRINNSERGAARNAGARFALNHLHAEWLLFLDADDVLAPGSLNPLLAQAKPTDKIISAKYRLWDGKKTFGPAKPPTPLSKNVTDSFLKKNPLALGTTLLHCSVYEAVGGFSANRDLSGSEDWVFLFKASMQAKVSFLENVLVFYRRHMQNTSPERTEKAMNLALLELRPALVQYYGVRSRWAYRQLQKNHALMIVGAYNSSGASHKAFQLFCSYARKHPSSWVNPRAWRTFASVLTRKFVL